MPTRPEPTLAVADPRIVEDAEIRQAEIVAVERDLLGHEEGDPCSWKGAPADAEVGGG